METFNRVYMVLIRNMPLEGWEINGHVYISFYS